MAEGVMNISQWARWQGQRKRTSRAYTCVGWNGRKEVGKEQRKKRQNDKDKFCTPDRIGKVYIR